MYSSYVCNDILLKRGWKNIRENSFVLHTIYRIHECMHVRHLHFLSFTQWSCMVKAWFFTCFLFWWIWVKLGIWLIFKFFLVFFIMGFNFFIDVVDLEILNFYLIVLRIFQISIKCYNHFQVGRVVLSISDVLCPCNHEYNISQWWMIINLIPWGKVNYLREYTVFFIWD